VNGSRKIILVIFVVSVILPLFLINANPVHSDDDDAESWNCDAIETLSITDDLPTNLTYWESECSSVIVTGSAAKDGRAILMKNRDWPLEPSNRPIYVPSTTTTLAYVGVNRNTMGINEKGLAVMNTAMPDLESEPGLGNLNLNQEILEHFKSVASVAYELNNSRSPIGPIHRSSLGTIATCIGVIDRFGAGAFFEISNTEAYVQYIVDGYDTRANHPRIFRRLASGPSGRDQYLLDILDAVYAKNGVISWEDVMQNASRYVRNKELGQISFSIDGEVCNTGTVAAMVAVSGDDRYDGQLNVMWGAYGPTPLVSVFTPSMVVAGKTPDSLANLWPYTNQKYESAQLHNDPILLDPYRVREIQKYAFFAEEYTINEYDRLMSSVHSGLSNDQIQTTLKNFIDRVDNYAVEVFVQESFDIDVPVSVSFPASTSYTTTPSITTTESTTTSIITTVEPVSSSTATSEISNNTPYYFAGIVIDTSLLLGLGIGGAISIVMVLVFLKKNQ